MLTCIIRRAPFLPSLDAALQVWACALKGESIRGWGWGGGGEDQKRPLQAGGCS